MTAVQKRRAKGAGRPRFGADVLKPRSLRTTDAQWAKVERLGGAAWLRKKIDGAKE